MESELALAVSGLLFATSPSFAQGTDWTASPQLLPPPGGAGTGAPPARVDSLLTSGTQTLAFDLGRLVAQSKLDGTTAMSLSSQSHAVSMVMHLGITVSGETR